MNSYCDSLLENLPGPKVENMGASEGIKSIGSNSSSFMAIINDYCGVGKVKLVDYDLSSWAESALSSTNERRQQSNLSN